MIHGWKIEPLGLLRLNGLPKVVQLKKAEVQLIIIERGCAAYSRNVARI